MSRDIRAESARSRKNINIPILYKRLISMGTEFFGPRLLDFGCGYSTYKEYLEACGFEYFGHDLVFRSKAARQITTEDLKVKKFSTVVMSNVLNCQRSVDQISESLLTASLAVDQNGYLYLNYTKSPRKMPNVNNEKMLEIVCTELKNHFTLIVDHSDVLWELGEQIYLFKKTGGQQ